MMLLVSCSGAKHVARSIARKLNAAYSELELKRFPDGELDVSFQKNVKGETIILVQSFFGNVNDKIVEALFALHTAKQLKAKKTVLVALHFPYMRKDKRFKPGDCISAKIMADLFKVADKVFVVEPHLHRIKKMNQLFSNGKRITVIPEIACYIKNLKLKNALFIGPDIESSQWAKQSAKMLNKKAIILRKTRYAARKVKINAPKTDLRGKNVVIIDDIISTGHTMLETIKALKKLKPKRIYCVAIHGIFAENALKKLSKYAQIVSCNTIQSPAAKIDVSGAVAEAIKNA